jgi:hypothetical protein
MTAQQPFRSRSAAVCTATCERHIGLHPNQRPYSSHFKAHSNPLAQCQWQVGVQSLKHKQSPGWPLTHSTPLSVHPSVASSSIHGANSGIPTLRKTDTCQPGHRDSRANTRGTAGHAAQSTRHVQTGILAAPPAVNSTYRCCASSRE